MHDAFAGENGDIVITLDNTAADDDVSQGSFFEANNDTPVNIPPEDVTDFLNGGYYFNVHSAANVPGELRDQVTPNNVQAIITTLEGQQENPAIESPWIGPIHIHNGFAGENGAAVLPLQPLAGSDINYRGAEVDILPGESLDFVQLLQGGHYLNVHSAANGGDELREQLVTFNSLVLRTELSGSQTLPVADDTLVSLQSPWLHAKGFFTKTILLSTFSKMKAQLSSCYDAEITKKDKYR